MDAARHLGGNTATLETSQEIEKSGSINIKGRIKKIVFERTRDLNPKCTSCDNIESPLRTRRLSRNFINIGWLHESFVVSMKRAFS